MCCQLFVLVPIVEDGLVSVTELVFQHKCVSVYRIYTSAMDNPSCGWRTYRGDHTAGPDAVTHAHSHQVLVVWILSPPHQHLMTHEVGLFIDHEKATLHSAGVTPTQIRSQLWAVAASFIGSALEVPVLVEDNLQSQFKTLNSFFVLNKTMNLCLTSDEL